MSRTPELTAVERAQLDAFEAAAYAEDALRERVARAMYTAAHPSEDWLTGYPEEMRNYFRRLADAALAVVHTPVDGAA